MSKSLGTLSVMVVFATFLLVPSIVPAEDGAAYVGGDKCRECHTEIAAIHAKSVHGRAWADRTDPLNCEACHGPGSKHVANPSPETIVTFGKGSVQTADEQSRRCLECHSGTKAVSLWEMGEHQKNQVACTKCHSIHKGPSPAAKDPETCFVCHKDVRYEANKQSHHPIIEGKIRCSDCHNPHGALGHKMIRDENINQLCYKCHADKRGPYVWEHPPVEENCATCHNPHGSKAYKLLREKVPNLCQDCHEVSLHPSTPYDLKTGFKGSAPSNRFFARSCLNCHSNIHGSFGPANPDNTINSGQFFVR